MVEARATGPEVIRLCARDGAKAKVRTNGGHVISWCPAAAASGKYSALYLSSLADLGPGTSIRGGIPVIFPQFAGLGPVTKHGFARTSTWKFLGHTERQDGAAVGRFQLSSCDATRAIWPHDFLAVIDVSVLGDTLSVSLVVTNSGTNEFSFTGALHTYLATGGISETTICGLENASFRDSANNDEMCQPTGEAITFEGEVDRIYFDVDGPLVAETPHSIVEVSADGFADVVVWNPGAELAAEMADLPDDGYRHFVCVEAAAIGTPITLPTGDTWTGSQTLRWKVAVPLT